MKLKHLLELVVEELKLESVPEKNKQGLYTLEISPTLQVTFSEISPHIYFSSHLMDLPHANTYEALYIYLMKANLLGQGTGGAVIGLDMKEEQLTFSYTLSHVMNYKKFKETLEDFLNYLEFWREEIDRFNTSIL